jgi:hypothetical protein
MIILGIKLLIAHVLGDFVFQPDSWVESKKNKKHKSIYFYLHGLVHFVSLLVLLEFKWTYGLGILIIVMSHLLIDLIKLNLDRLMNSRLLFVIDQLLHLFVIGFVVHYYVPFKINIEAIYSISVLITILSLLLLTFVSSILMKTIMSKWKLKEDSPEDSLEQAGKYIGILERLFVFVFIILNQWSAIGLLIAAKSILRFSDLSRAKDRKLTEYVIIGTLLSFGLATSIGLLYKYVLIRL